LSNQINGLPLTVSLKIGKSARTVWTSNTSWLSGTVLGAGTSESVGDGAGAPDHSRFGTVGAPTGQVGTGQAGTGTGGAADTGAAVEGPPASTPGWVGTMADEGIA
jgi:hypothetical protein